MRDEPENIIELDEENHHEANNFEVFAEHEDFRRRDYLFANMF